MENFRLKVFRTVAEQASFRKASERLNLSQPAVSQQVHALEEELGVTLFDRTGNRVRLTPEVRATRGTTGARGCRGAGEDRGGAAW
jgi:DNA-binding transcriptional LysR family regulator